MSEDINLVFDNSFQNKVIIALQTDFKFLQSIYDILDAEYFESDGRKWIVNTIKTYYKKYKNVPSLDVFKNEYDKEENDLLKINIKQKLKEAYIHKDATDLQYIKDSFREFCIHQNFKKVIYDSVDLVKDNKFSAIKKLFDNALKAGQPNDLGKDLLEESPHRILNEEKRVTIQSPWSPINKLLDGGFGKKELYTIIANPGAGKCIGPNSVIDIQYEQIGIDFNGYIIWFEPWETVNINDNMIYAYEFADMLIKFINTGTGKTI